MVAAAATAGAQDCQCRYSGQRYEQGETVCMRGRMARCGMYLNNSSWEVLEDACPLASLQKPELPAASPARAVR